MCTTHSITIIGRERERKKAREREKREREDRGREKGDLLYHHIHLSSTH